jgi:hypothetical protein
MIYTCVTGADTGGLCEATSSDGVSWDLVDGDDPTIEGVVLRSRPGEWDENIETAALVRTADGYELYYSGYRDLDKDGNRPPAALGLATSADGEAFVRAGDAPILVPVPGGADGVQAAGILQTEPWYAACLAATLSWTRCMERNRMLTGFVFMPELVFLGR